MTAMIDLVSNIIYKGDVSAAAYFMGAMETINAAMQMISNPLWGVLSDQYGRKPFMLLSIIGFAAEMFWIAADVSFLSLVGATLLRGVTGVTYSLAATYTVDIAPSHDQMSVYLGYNAAAGGFGFMIGAGLSAVIGGLAGAKTTFCKLRATLDRFHRVLLRFSPTDNRKSFGVLFWVLRLYSGVRLCWGDQRRFYLFDIPRTTR